MNIKLICDSDKELLKLKRSLKNKMIKGTEYKKYKVSFDDSKSYDLLIVLSNELEYIYSNTFEIKDNKKLIILTSNLRSANVVGCLNITPYLYYIKTDIDNIIFKIIRVYEKKV